MRRPIELLALVSGASLLALASVAAWRIVTPPPGGAHISSRSAPPPLARTSELQQAVTDDTPLPLLSEDAVRLAPTSPSPHPSEAVAEQRFDGPMEQVLYAGDRPALAPNLVAQALRLFSHKLDLTRDLALGDRVRLLVRGGGTPRLDFAELDGARGAVRLYRIADQGEDADAFADATGAPLRRLLLRTPLAHPRLTSGFGLRFHPLLGYTRVHEGVDFGAPVGTPVLAAGDGVVEATRWAGGYGRTVRLRHSGGFETLYAHLSAWAPQLIPGTSVHQGQVIGWTGDSGLSTGPHLHFEVRSAGRPIDPATAAPPTPVLSAAERFAFATRRRELDALLADTPATTASVATSATAD